MQEGGGKQKKKEKLESPRGRKGGAVIPFGGGGGHFSSKKFSHGQNGLVGLSLGGSTFQGGEGETFVRRRYLTAVWGREGETITLD